ncbi:hypothetical protein [Bacteroides sedimenti]|uniref:Lipocalin-like domain-containing protein n=1 Tax=Bacteroides sedimenti TaxID=2136147 RepID=A0ABM8ICL2_9BACE
MKAVKFFFYLIVLFTISSCTQHKKILPIGAWKLVFAQQMSGDSVVNKFSVDKNGTQLKIWSENNFFFVGRKKMDQDTAFSDTYGSGTYKLTDNQYQEVVLYHHNKLVVNTVINMILEIKGDTLTQSWPVDQYGKVIPANYYVEKYIRLK